MGKRRRGKSKQKSSVGSKRDGTLFGSVVRQVGGEEEEEVAVEVEGEGAPPKGKRQKISRDPRNGQVMSVLSRVMTPNVSPIGNGSSLDMPSTSCDTDSDSGDDDDLPDVSVSFGTPSREGSLTYDSITEGMVYWMVFPRWPPWPAVVVAKSKHKIPSVQALFFNDVCDYPKDSKGYQIKIRNGIAGQFSEMPTERDKFMMEKVETHKRYHTFKTFIDMAVEDAKLYITRKDEVGAGGSVKDLFDSIVARRKITREADRPEGSTPKFVRGLAFPDENDSDCEVENEEEEQSEGEGEGEGEGSSRAGLMGICARHWQGENIDPRYDYQYCTKFFRRKKVKEELKGIMESRVPSRRHNTFFGSSNKERHANKFSSHLGPLGGLTTVQKEKIVEKLNGFVMEWKCEEAIFSEKQYTFDVMLPEAIVRMIADVEKVPLDAAEHKYCNWCSLSLVTEPAEQHNE